MYSFSESRASDVRPIARVVLFGAILVSIILAVLGSKLAVILRTNRPIGALAFVTPFLFPPLIVLFADSGVTDGALLLWISVGVSAVVVSFGSDYFLRSRNENGA